MTDSIQGEQQQARQSTVWANDADVDEYARNADENDLICRERARHIFAPVRKTGMRFTRVTPEGFMERRVICEVCEKVERVELWDLRHNRDTITRCELVTAYNHYLDSSYLGRTGRGRMKPRQIRNSNATILLEGSSLRAARKAAMTMARTRQAG